MELAKGQEAYCLLEETWTKVVVKSDIRNSFSPCKIARLDSPDKTFEVLPVELFSKNPADFTDDVADCVTIPQLEEAYMLENMRQRYFKDRIYTYIGPIIVAINPYQTLELYSEDVQQSYLGKAQGERPPHLYAAADVAYREMRKDQRSQSFLISGESGAGKTESTKIILRYLAKVSRSSGMGSRDAEVERQILEANPVLEAFGNAKTLRNDNSSRFGKFFELAFNESGSITGASIVNYLLEKSRVTFQAKGERTYHIMYQLCRGCTEEEKESLFLKDISHYSYLNGSGCTTVDGMDDRAEFELTKDAMRVIGISSQDRTSIFRILSAVLALGNIEFEQTEGDALGAACVSNIDDLSVVADLLNIDGMSLNNALCNRTFVARGEETSVPLNREKSMENRDALAKALYGLMFQWIVDQINANLKPPRKTAIPQRIGVLDIFGFEAFENNSFEQLCINFANESLQQQFIENVFKYEQEEYEKDGIDWKKIDFSDNQACIDLFNKNPTGMFALLDEECAVPNGSDRAFNSKMDNLYAKHAHYKAFLQSDTKFTIHHYAGSITYDCSAFLDKNRDRLQDDLATLMSSSEDALISSFFVSAASEIAGGGNGRRSARESVSKQFRQQLAELRRTLHPTTCHYVRCVKPNEDKKPRMFAVRSVMSQLRCTGVFETVAIRKQGYAARFAFQAFAERYMCLLPDPGVVKPHLRNPAASKDALVRACSDILKRSELDSELFAIGHTKLYLKDDAAVKRLEDERSARLYKTASIIAANWKCSYTYRWYKKTKPAAQLLSRVIRGYVQKAKYSKMISEKRAKEKKEREATEAAERRVRSMRIQQVEEESRDDIAEKVHERVRHLKPPVGISASERQNVFNDFMSQFRMYGKRIRVLYRDYMESMKAKALESHSEELSMDMVLKIFANVRELYQHARHTVEIIDKNAERFQESDIKGFGDFALTIFSDERYESALSKYTDSYVSRMAFLYAKLNENPDLKAFVEGIAYHKNVRLQTLLLEPLQRVYDMDHVLLRLYAATPPDHEESLALLRVLKKLQVHCDAIVKCEEEYRRNVRSLQLYDRMEGLDLLFVTDGARQLLHEGPVKKLKKKTYSDWHLALFDDRIIKGVENRAKNARKPLLNKGEIDLKGASVQIVQAAKGEPEPKRFWFEITAGKKSYRYGVLSSAERSIWVKKVKQVVDGSWRNELEMSAGPAADMQRMSRRNTVFVTMGPNGEQLNEDDYRSLAEDGGNPILQTRVTKKKNNKYNEWYITLYPDRLVKVRAPAKGKVSNLDLSKGKEIPLRGARVSMSHAKGFNKHYFEIAVGPHVWLYGCDTERERAQWVEVLSDAIAKAEGGA